MEKSDYLSGVNFGLPHSCKVHRLANIAGQVIAGENCRIDAFVTVTGRVKLGDCVHLSTGSAIFGTHGVEIGRGCSLSPGAKIFTATDDIHSDALANPQLHGREDKCGGVRMGEFSVVGANSVVLPNVTIGNQVQVGANAVIRTDVPDNQVWVGNPGHYLCPRATLDIQKIMGDEVTQ